MSGEIRKVRKGGNPNPQGNKGKGRKKGVPNKNTKALKDMILAALEGAGGIEYLQRQAETNPGPFMTLVGKVLPLQVTGEGGGPVETSATLIVKGVKPSE